MTFDSGHYVPVLKMKRGEKKALQLLERSIRVRLTPLIEVVEMDGKKTLAAHLDTAFKDFRETAALYPRYFLDAGEISPAGEEGAAGVFQRAARLGVAFTPVTGITRTVDVAPALAHRDGGLAIRLTRAEFEAGQLPDGLTAFIAKHYLRPEEVDLIADLGPVENMVADGIAMLTDGFLSEIPEPSRWRTLTVSGCAFPRSMWGVGKHSHALVDREEWRAWRDNLYSTRSGPIRLPAFSDCAIQHPDGVEGFDPLTMQVSASVRYALPEQWLLMKGESTRNVPPSEQFPKLAIQLAYGHLADHFAGPSHCKGCQGIQDAADGFPGFSAPETWRRLGTIHHLTQTVESLAGLTWP